MESSSVKDQVKEEYGTPKKFRHVFRILEVCLAFAVILNVVLVTLVLTRNTWDPLGSYPVQTVTNKSETVATMDGATISNPTIHVPKDIDATWPTVNIDATKCADEEVSIRGQSSWRQVEPPGFSYANPPGVNVRALGCQSFHYHNEFPMEIRKRIKELSDEGVTKTIWQIGGEETPVSNDGKTGGVRLYQSQNFTVVYGE